MITVKLVKRSFRMMLAAGLLLLVTTAGCIAFGNSDKTPSEDPSGPSNLEEALGMAPEIFSDEPVKFADHSGAREAAGMEDVGGVEAYLELSPEQRRRLSEGMPGHQALSGSLRSVKEDMGLDQVGFDQGVWVDEPANSEFNFIALDGLIDTENMLSKLPDLEYTEAEYAGTPYYWLYEEPEADLRHPLRQMAPYLNRVALADEIALFGSTDRVITSLIDVQQGDGDSLAESMEHLRLARAMGGGVLGGVFMRPEWLQDEISGLNGAQVERHTEGTDAWGQLSRYDLAFLGYQIQDDEDKFVVALYYGSPDSAEKDAEELEERWESFSFNPSWGSGASSSPGGGGTPVTESCSSLSTRVLTSQENGGSGLPAGWPTAGPIVEDTPNFSILVGTCATTPGDRQDPVKPGAGLWKSLYESRELSFLLQDLDRLSGE